MKSILLVLFLIPLFAISQKKHRKKNIKEQQAYITKTDTIVIYKNYPLDKIQIIKLDSANADLIREIANKQENKYLRWLPLAIAGFALLFTIRTFRRDKSYKDLTFLSELDKALIQQPELWAYEDEWKARYESSIELVNPSKIKIKGKEKLFIKKPYEIKIIPLTAETIVTINEEKPQKILKSSPIKFDGTTDSELFIENDSEIEVIYSNGVKLQSQSDKSLEGKIEAYCYYKLNNFEFSLKRHSNIDNAIAWKNYLKFIYDHSSAFKKVVNKAIANDHKMHSIRFVKKLEGLTKNVAPIELNFFQKIYSDIVYLAMRLTDYFF